MRKMALVTENLESLEVLSALEVFKDPDKMAVKQMMPRMRKILLVTENLDTLLDPNLES